MALDNPIMIDGVEIDDIDEDEEVETSRTYKIDFDSGHIIGMIDEEEAILQYCKKSLITPRFKCLIYDDTFGSEIKDVVMDDQVSQEFVAATLPDEVKEALIYDERILDVTDIETSFDREKDEAFISIKIKSIYGDLYLEEVIE